LGHLGGVGVDFRMGRRFSSRALQTSSQKPDATHFIVDSPKILKKGIPAVASMLSEIAPL
jgi:hypothetical protein